MRRSIESKQHVDYWDVVNEPGTAESGSGTAAQYLEQFRRAHAAIRSVDPDAKIVGPSIPVFAGEPYGVTGYRSRLRDLDLETFLDYIESNDLRFDAISWHESATDSREVNPVRTPADVIPHVRHVRKLISDRPGVGEPEIHVNEYSVIDRSMAPGWSVGWFAALESADVDQAMRTCFTEPHPAPPTSTCTHGMLDGLLERTGEPRSVYWVHRAYAEAVGIRIPSELTREVSTYATKNDSVREVRALVGRHSLCSLTENGGCGSYDSHTRDLEVEIKLPYAFQSARVAVLRIANRPGPSTGPEPFTVREIRPDGPWITIALLDVADGDAFSVRVSPA